MKQRRIASKGQIRPGARRRRGAYQLPRLPKASGVTRHARSDPVNVKARLSVEMTIRLSKPFGS